MKKLSIILTTLIFLTACTAQEKQEDVFMQIASSQEYAKYMEAIYGRAGLVAQNQVDLEGVRQILEMNIEAESMEAIGSDAFSKVKGGLMYYDYIVDFEARLQELDAKYSFKSISKEQRMEISKLYEQITNGAERKKARDAAFHHLQNRQK